MLQTFDLCLQHHSAKPRRHIASDVGTLIRLRKQRYKKNNESPTPISTPVLRSYVNCRYKAMSVYLFILACYPSPYVFAVCLIGCCFSVEIGACGEFRQA